MRERISIVVCVTRTRIALLFINLFIMFVSSCGGSCIRAKAACSNERNSFTESINGVEHVILSRSDENNSIVPMLTVRHIVV